MEIENAEITKHKCIASLLYSAGLRRVELLNLKLQDIDSKRMVIMVKNGKGGKDIIIKIMIGPELMVKSFSTRQSIIFAVIIVVGLLI